jgi:hypothetical protein
MAVLGATLFGCGGADEPPLGGPYGGTAPLVSPSNRQARSDGGVIDRCLAQFMGTASVRGVGVSDGGAPADGNAGPSWMTIYTNYLSNCAGSGCHVEMSTAAGGYQWLRKQGYIDGTNSTLIVPGKSCLTCYCGDMPPLGSFNAQAIPDMNAWVAAGAMNN